MVEKTQFPYLANVDGKLATIATIWAIFGIPQNLLHPTRTLLIHSLNADDDDSHHPARFLCHGSIYLNSLFVDVRLCQSVTTFKRNLKTHFCKPLNPVCMLLCIF